MIKAIGFCLLLACGAAFGIARCGECRRSAALAEAYLTLLRHLRAQIESYALPVPRILAAYDQSVFGIASRTEDFSELLAVTAPFLRPPVLAVLREFASGLGNAYREEQLRRCGEAIARLAPLCETARKESAREARVWLWLPPAFAAILGLLLL